MRRLSSHTLPWPADWAALFGATRPLVVEIGFGSGVYLIDLARRHPDCSVIGIEIANQSLSKAEDKIARHKLPNARVVHSTAETALHHLFEPASISQIHVNFPDPWFKSAHHHRRLMKRPTLDAMVNRLAPGGTLYLATDILAYAEMCADLFAAAPGLTNLLPTPWVHDMPGRTITKYEARARDEGRACYYFAHRRNDAPAPEIPVIKDLEMPHVVFSSPLTHDEMCTRFAPSKHDFGDIHIHVIECFRGADSLLFDVYVNEPTIDQRIAVRLTARPQPHEYTLSLGPIGHPRATQGIHQAVALLGQWLVSLHPDAAIIQHKVQDT